jgi:hypothetical protein
MRLKAIRPSKSEIAADSPVRQPDDGATKQIEQHNGAAMSLLWLQRAHGNRYVQRIIQAKLAVSHPGDPHEREAVQVAKDAINMPDAITANPIQQAMSPEADREFDTKPPAAPISPNKPIQTYMEPGPAADFRVLRVNTGSDARQMNPSTKVREGVPVNSAIQRDGAGTQREFIPQVTRDPDLAIMKIYGHHRQSFRINNRREAPAHTSFQWGFGVDPNGVIDLLSDRAIDGGTTQQVEVEGRQPGASRIQATPVYQVPGGPEMTGETRYADISVEEPTLQLLSIMYRRADGGGITTARLGVGDKIIARVMVGNVDGGHMPNAYGYSLAGQGTHLVSSGSIKPVQQFGDGKSYDVELVARTPGSVNAELEFAIGGLPLGRGPKVTGIHAEIEYNRQEFINLANQCDTKVNIAYTRVNSIMEVLSAAYGNAYDAHVKVLEAQDASNRLVGELILNAALAFIPGGVGGTVGGLMKSAKFNDFMVDAVKDMAKAGTKGLQGALVSGGGGRGPMKPMADDPRTWRAQYAVRVNSEKEYVLGILDDWKTKAISSAPEFYMNFSPVTVTEQSLTRDGQPLTAIEVPDQAEYQKKFELGFWRDWLQNFAYTVETTATREGMHYFAGENQGKKIRDRITALGENGDQWLEEYGGVARRRAEAEAERRNRERFRPTRPFYDR